MAGGISQTEVYRLRQDKTETLQEIKKALEPLIEADVDFIIVEVNNDIIIISLNQFVL